VIDEDLDAFRRELLAWYDRHARVLPWRVPVAESGRPDPYHVLVSEFMLQQTQVATVVPFFARWLDRFPTIRSLAAADEQDVLRLWQGLGYYSRARNLLKAARAILNDHAGSVPTTVDELLKLPGVGRYTAGAIASIAHGTRAPIVRVISRLDAIRGDPREPTNNAILWSRADALVPADRPGDLNSALMELGATVCAPRNPQCLICPVARFCAARDANVQADIPPPKQRTKTPLSLRTIYCLQRHVGERVEYAFEQRPPTGRWAGMWQFITRELTTSLGVCLTDARTLGTVTHSLTHRRYEFTVVHALVDPSLSGPLVPTAKWLTLDQSEDLPLPKPHVVTRDLLRGL
jgi:A/G-specific adenine glycosylase